MGITALAATTNKNVYGKTKQHVNTEKWADFLMQQKHHF